MCAKRATMGFFEGFKRGYEDDCEYEIAGKTVTCSHCGSTDFDEREGKVNTTGLTLLDLDWANRSALVLVCKRCGHRVACALKRERHLRPGACGREGDGG